MPNLSEFDQFNEPTTARGRVEAVNSATGETRKFTHKQILANMGEGYKDVPQDPVIAIHHGPTSDEPIKVVGSYGLGPDGKEYMIIEGSTTGIPREEIEFSLPQNDLEMADTIHRLRQTLEYHETSLADKDDEIKALRDSLAHERTVNHAQDRRIRLIERALGIEQIVPGEEIFEDDYDKIKPGEKVRVPIIIDDETGKSEIKDNWTLQKIIYGRDKDEQWAIVKKDGSNETETFSRQELELLQEYNLGDSVAVDSHYAHTSAEGWTISGVLVKENNHFGHDGEMKIMIEVSKTDPRYGPTALKKQVGIGRLEVWKNIVDEPDRHREFTTSVKNPAPPDGMIKSVTRRLQEGSGKHQNPFAVDIPSGNLPPRPSDKVRGENTTGPLVRRVVNSGEKVFSKLEREKPDPHGGFEVGEKVQVSESEKLRAALNKDADYQFAPNDLVNWEIVSFYNRPNPITGTSVCVARLNKPGAHHPLDVDVFNLVMINK